MFEYSPERERIAEENRQMWASMTRKEKRRGLVFGLAVWAAFMAITVWEGLCGPGIF